MSDQSQGTGVLALDDIWQFVQAMFDHERTEPVYFLVSPKTMRRLRRWERLRPLYAATALPRRKLRKCVERRILARRAQGRRHIDRLACVEENATQQILDATCLLPYKEQP